jgi:hypothetical protein
MDNVSLIHGNGSSPIGSGDRNSVLFKIDRIPDAIALLRDTQQVGLSSVSDWIAGVYGAWYQQRQYQCDKEFSH